MEKDILDNLKMNSRDEAVSFLKSLWNEHPKPCPLCNGKLDFLHKKANINNMRKDLPVYFIAGALDPVGENGKGVARAYDSFVSVGMTDVSLKLYKDMRHEILNEDIKDRVFEDVLFWINEKIG